MKTEFCKKAYYNPEDLSEVEHLITYLKELGGKELKSAHIRQFLFKTEWKTKEDSNRDRCQIQAAKEYLEFLKEKKDSKNQIKTLIADLITYIEILDNHEDVSFIVANSNIIHSTIHFHSAKNIFYQHQILESHQENHMSDLLSVYALRLSLEKKIRGILGIDFAVSRGQKIGLSTFIEVLRKLKTIQYSEVFDWQEIKLVNNWANHFMHRHIRPYPWVIYQAIQILEPLLNSKKSVILKNGKKLKSFDSPGYVENEKNYDSEIKNLLIEKYPAIKIYKLDYKEVIIDEG